MKKLSLLSFFLFFCCIALAFANEDENPFTRRPKKFFGIPIEFAYAFVAFVFAIVIIYAVLKYVFVEE